MQNGAEAQDGSRRPAVECVRDEEAEGGRLEHHAGQRVGEHGDSVSTACAISKKAAETIVGSSGWTRS